MIVGVLREKVEAILAAGIGPALQPEARCPVCAGELASWVTVSGTEASLG